MHYVTQQLITESLLHVLLIQRDISLQFANLLLYPAAAVAALSDTLFLKLLY